jgi:hypothetical protein
MTDQLTTIYEALIRLHNEGGTGNFVVFTAHDEKNYYVQVAGEKEGDSLFVEAVGNKSLTTQFRLNEIKINHLMQLGWTGSGEDENFNKTISINSDVDRRNVAEFLYKSLHEVYGLSVTDEMTVNLSLE